MKSTMKRIAHLIIIIFAMCFVLNGIAACDTEQEEPPATQPKTYTVEFISQVGGGRILGEEVQTVIEGQSTRKVVAVANDGYYFAGWADTGDEYDETVKTSGRVIENVRESRGYLAMFEKITLQIEYVA